MTGIAITPTAIINDSLTSTRNGVLPAIIGALGAVIILNVLPPLFAIASIPISVLEVVPGIRSRTIEALSAGGLAIACAAILWSQAFALRRMPG